MGYLRAKYGNPWASQVFFDRSYNLCKLPEQGSQMSFMGWKSSQFPPPNISR